MKDGLNFIGSNVKHESKIPKMGLNLFYQLPDRQMKKDSIEFGKSMFWSQRADPREGGQDQLECFPRFVALNKAVWGCVETRSLGAGVLRHCLGSFAYCMLRKLARKEKSD